MRKALFVTFALALLLAVSSVSALDYHYYVVGHGDVTNGYTDTTSSVYDKATSDVNTPWGSESHTVVKRTNTESFQPNYPAYSGFAITPGGFNNGHYYTTDNGFDNYNNAYNAQNGRYSDPYEDPRTVYSSNWRFASAYNSNDYPNQNTYGYDYYYQPVYDWHAQLYNWNY